MLVGEVNDDGEAGAKTVAGVVADGCRSPNEFVDSKLSIMYLYW